ncbi:MAG: hypothetical protein HYR80_07900 [Nitrospirae bacterium]|nr:hypothetical protein [Nitrospirota bacterium]
MKERTDDRSHGNHANVDERLCWEDGIADSYSSPGGFNRGKLKEMMREEKQLLQIAFCFRINPTPLRKIVENIPPSSYIIKRLRKVEADLNNGKDLMDFIAHSPRGEKLVSIFELYQREGSLEKVGRLVHLSRERVRQLLNKGTELGLFEYKKPHSQMVLSGKN